MLTFDRLPIMGPCLAFRPPGHAPHVLDVLGIDGTELRPAEVPLWRALFSIGVDRFYGWRRSIVAPLAGTVVAVHDGEPDRRTVSLTRDVLKTLVVAPLRSGKDLGAMAGNHVVVESVDGFVLLAHLRQGTVDVSEGDTLIPGDPLGHVGNSGNSLMPHVHVQAMTSADPLTATALPWQVTSLVAHIDGTWQAASGPVPLRRPVHSP